MNKQTLLNTIAASNKLRTDQEWAGFFDFQNYEDTKEFFNLVRELEAEAEIIRTNKGKLQTIEQSDVVKGIISINPKGYGFVDAQTESYYIPAYQFKTAMNGDEVLVKPRVFADLSKEGEILKVLKRNTSQLVGTWRVSKQQSGIELTDPRIQRKLNVVESDTTHLVDGQQLRLSILSYGEELDVKIVEVLGHIDDPGMDITTILLNHQIPMKFKEDVLTQVEKMPTEVLPEEIEGRTDYRNLVVVTIDGEDAKDFDDAISLKRMGSGYQLDVHIADVSHYVTERSPLDEEARVRGTSVYVIDRVVPMLPHALSNGLCSLMEGVNRLTLTCSMQLDFSGEVISYDIHPSIIKSTRRMTYSEVNRILKGEEVIRTQLSHLVDLFELMHEVSSKIRTIRNAAGSINFSSVESKFILTKEGVIDRIEARTQDMAEMLIEDFMILANETVARHTMYLDVPSLYRIHETPDRKRFASFMRIARFFNLKVRYEHLTPKILQGILDRYEGKPEQLLINDMLLRSMAKAKYDPRCLGHFGLALKEYCHFTSPIRRYPDLIVHRMLRRHVFSHHPELLAQDAHTVEELGNETSWAEQRSVEAERDVEAMKKAEYMEAHIGMQFDGIVSSVAKFGFFVRLSNTVEGLVHVKNLSGYYEFDEDRFALVKRGTRQSFHLGQKVKIKVLAASKANQTIDFIVV